MTKQKRQVPSLLQSIWRYVQSWFAPSNEIQIWEITDVDGSRTRIYNPKSDRTFELDSPSEVLTWLEERYYDRAQNNVWDSALWR